MEEELLAEKFKFIAFVSALELDDFPADHEVGIANAPLESITPFVITSITDPVMFTLQTSCIIIAQLNVDVLIDLRIQFLIIAIIIVVWIMRTKP